MSPAEAITEAPRPGVLPEASRTCEQCDSPFTPRKSWQVFCSSRCRDDFHIALRSVAREILREKRRVDAGI